MADLVQALGDALNRDLEALNSVAQNLANVNTPGYKSVSVVPASEVQFNALVGSAELSADENAVALGAGSALNSDFNGMAQVQSKLNLQAGSLKQTKRSLDIAITGNGFLVLNESGKEVYSRNGSLKVDANGMLTNTAGFPVLSESGPVYIEQPKTLKIAKNGELFEADRLIGKLKLVEFVDIGNVQLNGNGTFYAPPGNLRSAEKSFIHQGFIETSNVDTTKEMMRMMELSKHFESVQRALSIYDQAMSSGISKIGK